MKLPNWLAQFTTTARQFWHQLQQVLATGQNPGYSQNQGNNQETRAFFWALLQAEMKGGETEVYQVLDQRGGQIDPQLPQVAQTFLELFSIAKPEMRDLAVGVIENLAIRLQDYPRGHREINVAVAIALYRLVLTAHPRETVPDKWAQTQNNLGNAYNYLPTGDRAANLQQAITCYEAALTVWKQDTAPLQWATTQNNLGSTYKNLPTGHRAANLAKAIACYKAALTVRKPDTAPLDWAMTQNNLGNAYSDLPTGDGAANLQQAIACYEAALTVWKPDTAPLQWATTQNNLGSAYSDLPTGDRAANLQQAIACYEAALTVWKPDTAPLDWAGTQNNLGNAYLNLPTGDRAANLQQAIACYKAALTVRKPDTAPLDWAMTQNNLGNAYSDLPTGDRAANLQQAIACYEAALTVRKPDTAFLDWAMTQNNLGSAYSDLPTGHRAANLQQAIACYEAALTVWKQDTAPLQWATTQNNLGSAYSDLPTGDRAANLQQAIACYEAALTVRKQDTAPLDWAMTQNNLGSAYSDLPTGDRAANLQLAIACYEAALTVRKQDTAPLDWAMTQNNLGLAYSNLPTGDRAANLQQAIACYKAALTVWKQDTAPLDWAMTQNNLGNAYLQLPTGAANLQQAIACYEAALTVWKPNTAPLQWATTQNNLGNAYLYLPTGDRAANLQQAIACYKAALTVRKPDTAPLDWAATQNNLGVAYSDLPTGDRAANLQQAIACYEAALTVRKPELFPLDCLQTARNWANLEFNQGHWQEALQQYQVAIEAIEQSRRGALSEERRQQIVEESIYIYENAIQAAINLNDIPTALEIVERVRAKRLVDLLATADLYQNGDIPEPVRQYLQKLNDLDDQIAQKRGELSNDSRETKPDGMKTRQFRAATEVSEDIAQLEQQKAVILDQLSNLDEVVAKLRQVQPPKLADFIPLLQDSPGAAILSFYTTDDDTHIFILRHGETVPTCFTCKGQGKKTLQNWLIETWVIPYISNKTQWVAQMSATLAELSRRLEIDRLIAEQLQGLDELILIPHLFLHQIPFAALPVSHPSTSHTPPSSHTPPPSPSYFGDKFILRYAPSVQVLGFCHNRSAVTTQEYGIVENATNDLPCSGFEGAKVAEFFGVGQEKRLIGTDATRQNYRQLLEIITHLVSTHHAQSRYDNPLESGLQLSDGRITVSQLLSPGWRFKDLDEIFLSCCETGLFLPNSALDEPVAVSTGFLCAGSRGVIASQWAIYDLSAALLSILYHNQRKAGKNRPVALQAAQQEMREMTGAEFKKSYQKPLEAHFKAEKARILAIPGYDANLLIRVVDTEKGIKAYAADKGCPFQEPVHWASLGCYGLR